MKLAQCWDDGVATDARLVEVLRRHGAKASFNLNAGLHTAQRQFGWMHQGSEVWRFGWSEMREVYRGFTIANHSLTHPYLDRMAIEDARRDIEQGRERLQQFFGQSVSGFAYPFGAYDATVTRAVRDAGHVYARTTGDGSTSTLPVSDAMTLHPHCHFLAPGFWLRYAQAHAGGVFYFWGHSYEMTTEAMWAEFESTIIRLGSDPAARWCNVADLFNESADD